MPEKLTLYAVAIDIASGFDVRIVFVRADDAEHAMLQCQDDIEYNEQVQCAVEVPKEDDV